MSQILQSARISSRSIMEKIRGIGYDVEQALMALSLCCDTIRPTKMLSLAYLVSGEEEYPALLEHRSNEPRYVAIGNFSNPKPAMPEYRKEYSCGKEALHVFQLLEQQGLIYRNRITNEIRFTHPIFLYAGRMLFQENYKNSWDNTDLIRLGKRALGILDKRAGLCALDTLWYCIESGLQDDTELMKLVLTALNTIFPSVKDRTVTLLETRFLTMPEEWQGQLVSAIKEYKVDSYLNWNHGEPYITSDNVELSWMDAFQRFERQRVDPEKYNQINGKELSTQQIYNALNSRDADQLSLAFLNYAFQCDESIIRARAVYLIFKNCGSQIDVDAYLLPFEHGNVIFSIFRGAISSWKTYSQDGKAKLLTYICGQLSRLSVAFHMQRFLEKFGVDYQENGQKWAEIDDSECSDLWAAWCIIFTRFLNVFPPKYLRMDEENMDYTISSAGKYVNDKALLLGLFAAWENWLGKVKDASDYGMSLMSVVLQFLPAELREKLFHTMLTAEKTSIITTHVKYIVDYWKLTSFEEKRSFFALLSSERKDVMWLKAVALTQNEVPEEVQNFLLGSPTLFSNPREVAMYLKSESLLEPCLNVYCGYPQPLWYNGYHHNNSVLWDSVIQEVLCWDDIDCSFEVALREFIHAEYNYEDNYAERRKEIWEELLSGGKRKRTFHRLLHTTATNNQTNKGVWDHFFSACDREELTGYAKQIAEYIEPIESTQGFDGEILELFDSKFLFHYICPFLPNDMQVYHFCDEFLRCRKFGDERETFLSEVLQIYRESPPRMALTGLIAKRTADKLGLFSQVADGFLLKELKEAIDNRRKELIEEASKIEMQLLERESLLNWCY